MHDLIKRVKPIVKEYYRKNREYFKVQGMDYEDLLQEVSIKLWTKRASFVNDKVLVTSVYNFMKSMKRKSKVCMQRNEKDGKVIPKIVNFSGLAANFNLDETLEKQPTVIDDIQNEDLLKLVKNIVNKNEYRAIYLKVYEGQTLAEIAAEMDLTPEGVNLLYHKGLDKVRQSLEKNI